MSDGIVVGISGWFTPHGIRYHEDRRRRDEIADADWAALLAHADAIDFFTRPEPGSPVADARTYHLAITSDDRSRELAINDPFEAPELAKLVSLTRRAIRDRRVMDFAKMTAAEAAEFISRLEASVPTAAELRSDRFASWSLSDDQ